VFLVPNVQHVLGPRCQLLAQGGVDESVGLRSKHPYKRQVRELAKHDTLSYGIRQAFPLLGRRF
jgi:hypothetical protein